MSNEIVTWLKTELAKFESAPAVETVVTDVKSDAVDLEQWVATNGYPLIMQDALAAVTGMLTGTSWSALVSSLISTALAQGKTLEAGAANVALNLAQSQLIVAGTVAPVSPTPTA